MEGVSPLQTSASLCSTQILMVHLSVGLASNLTLSRLYASLLRSGVRKSPPVGSKAREGYKERGLEQLLQTSLFHLPKKLCTIFHKLCTIMCITFRLVQ